ncbi:MAG TPA: hypothetical protein VK996_04310, partial [Ramlibacter sp.]|nr:hypothetical protein [Ramlibacter sp.]
MNAWPLSPARHFPFFNPQVYLLLLLPLDRFSPPWLLRWLLPLLAPPRLLCRSLLPLLDMLLLRLALLPLLPLESRLRLDEDLELRAMRCSFESRHVLR